MPDVLVPLDLESDLWLTRYCEKHQADRNEVMTEAVLAFLSKYAEDLLPLPDGEED
jgi:hypothetical protein